MLNLNELLREKGYKVTKSRLAILKIFLESKIPLNAEIIYKKLVKNNKPKNINEATVYRTLTLFEENEILRRVDLRQNSVHFELNNDHYHHIVCIKCNLIETFKNCEIEKILGRIVEKSSKFKKIKEHSFELFGFCKECLIKTT